MFINEGEVLRGTKLKIANFLLLKAKRARKSKKPVVGPVREVSTQFCTQLHPCRKKKKSAKKKKYHEDTNRKTRVLR